MCLFCSASRIDLECVYNKFGSFMICYDIHSKINGCDFCTVD